VSTPQPPGIPDSPSGVPSVEATDVETPPAVPPSHEDRASTWQPALYLKLGVLLFAIGWGIAFVVENSKEINVHFVFATANVHLIWAMLLLFGVGLVGGVLLSQLYRHRRRSQLAQKARKPRNARGDVGR
jgi:uncharacterized integral membrane protein